jgi:hypothetical protein
MCIWGKIIKGIVEQREFPFMTKRLIKAIYKEIGFFRSSSSRMP